MSLAEPAGSPPGRWTVTFQSQTHGMRSVANRIRPMHCLSVVIPDVHRPVGRRELLRRTPSFEGFPCRLELRFRGIDVLGSASWAFARQMDGDIPEPDARHAFGRQSNSADALPTFKHGIVANVDGAELKHITAVSALANELVLVRTTRLVAL